CYQISLIMPFADSPLIPLLTCPPKPTAPPAPYTLSLHDALPICFSKNPSQGDVPGERWSQDMITPAAARRETSGAALQPFRAARSEEHTSELQSRFELVCRLLLEKKNRRHKHNDESALLCCTYED